MHEQKLGFSVKIYSKRTILYSRKIAMVTLLDVIFQLNNLKQ